MPPSPVQPTVTTRIINDMEIQPNTSSSREIHPELATMQNPGLASSWARRLRSSDIPTGLANADTSEGSPIGPSKRNMSTAVAPNSGKIHPLKLKYGRKYCKISDVWRSLTQFTVFLPASSLETREALQKLPGGGVLQFHRISARCEPPVFKMFYSLCGLTGVSSDRLLNSNAFCCKTILWRRKWPP